MRSNDALEILEYHAARATQPRHLQKLIKFLTDKPDSLVAQLIKALPERWPKPIFAKLVEKLKDNDPQTIIRRGRTDEECWLMLSPSYEDDLFTVARSVIHGWYQEEAERIYHGRRVGGQQAARHLRKSNQERTQAAAVFRRKIVDGAAALEKTMEPREIPGALARRHRKTPSYIRQILREEKKRN